MKRQFLIIFAIATIALSLSFWLMNSNLSNETKEAGVAIASPSPHSATVSTDSFPRFEVAGMDGKPIKLNFKKGQVTIVNFWATWCPPCRKEIPHFIELVKKYPNKLQMIGLSVEEGKDEAVAGWVKKNGVNYPIGIVGRDFQDPYQGLLPEEDRGGIPYTFILNDQGQIVDRLVGYRDMDFWKASIERVTGSK